MDNTEGIFGVWREWAWGKRGVGFDVGQLPSSRAEEPVEIGCLGQHFGLRSACQRSPSGLVVQMCFKRRDPVSTVRLARRHPSPVAHVHLSAVTDPSPA